MVNEIKDSLTKITNDVISKNSYDKEMLNDFEIKLREVVNKFENNSLKNEAEILLKEFNISINDPSVESSKIKEIGKQFLNIAKKLELKPVSIGLKIAFYCDIDAPDHNTAITSRLKLALQQKVPFITTRSMLRCTGINQEGKSVLEEALELEKILLEKQNDFEIYQKGEFVLFLPRSLLSEKTGKEKLEALDFDDSLEKIPLQEALQGPQAKSNLDDFFKIFVQKEPRIGKLFYIAGHGGETSVSALGEENYRKFLAFLEKQKCQGLIVTSCQSGGKSSLMNIPTKSQQNKKEEPEGHSFITVVRSIGDFPTRSDQKAEEDISLFFGELSAFLESSKPRTLSNLCSVINKVEGGAAKVRENFIKVYFPAADVPSGFRPLGEQGLGYRLSIIEARGSELASEAELHILHRSFLRRNTKPEISVTNRDYLEVLPLITETPVVFKGNDATLLSMIPGDGHHFLASIHLDKEEPLDYIEKTLKYHKDALISAEKGFFIGSLSSKNQTFKEVAFLLSPYGSAYTYREGDQYYFSDGTGPENLKKISPLQHAILCRNMMKFTTADERAVRSVSGGQESEELFRNTMKNPSLWPSNGSKEFVSSLESLLKNKSTAEALEIIKTKEIELGMSKEDKENLLFHLITLGFEDLAIELIKKEKNLLNIKNLQGSPLICHALRCKKFELVKYLIKEGVDLNVGDPTDNQYSPLHRATFYRNIEIVKLMLNDPKIDIEIKNNNGWTPVRFAIPKDSKKIENEQDRQINLEKLEIFNLLKTKQSNLDSISSDGFSLLSLYNYEGLNEEVEFLLSQSLDPNKGKPSPLTLAIQKNSSEIIGMLLKAGANPFEPDESGFIPFVQAALICPPEIFKIFLDQSKDDDLTKRDKDGISPLTATLFSGNTKKIEALLQRNISFPENFNRKDFVLLRHILNKMVTVHEEGMIRRLLALRPQSSSFNNLVSEILLTNNPKLLQKLIADDYIHPNLGSQGFSLFPMICSFVAKDGFEKYSELIATCLQKGADVHISSTWTPSPLTQAAQSKDKKFLRTLLEYADLTKEEDPKVTFEKIIELGDLELVKLACQKGAQIHTREKGVSSPLQWAASKLLKDKAPTIPESSKDVFKWLVAQGANLNLRGMNDRTPFGEVILSGNLDLVQYCLDHGAQLKPKGANIYSPIEIAASLQEPQILQEFIQLGGDINASVKGPDATVFTTFVKNVSVTNLNFIESFVRNFEAEVNPEHLAEKLTPLQAAINRVDDPNYEVFKKLISLGADINAPGNVKTPSPFGLIVARGDINMVNWCFDYGVRLNSEDRSSEALKIAISSGHLDILDLLLSRGKLKLSSDTITPNLIMQGYRNGGEKMLRKLLEFTDISAWSDEDKLKFWNLVLSRSDDRFDDRFVESLLKKLQPFKIALYEGVAKEMVKNPKLLKFLLDHELDANTIYEWSGIWSLLDFAFDSFPVNKDIIQMLLEAKANPCFDDKFTGMKSCLIYRAVERGDPEIVKMLLEKGAGKDIHIKDEYRYRFERKSALDLAREMTDKEIFNLLQKYTQAI